MAIQQIFEGTWEDILAQSSNLAGKQLRLVLFSVDLPATERAPQDGKHFYETATAEEFAPAFDNIGQGNEKLPVLPPEAFERESLYEESL